MALIENSDKIAAIIFLPHYIPKGMHESSIWVWMDKCMNGQGMHWNNSHEEIYYYKIGKWLAQKWQVNNENYNMKGTILNVLCIGMWNLKSVGTS